VCSNGFPPDRNDSVPCHWGNPVEAGLAAYDGALLIDSHDEAFLTAVGISRRLQMTPDAKDLDI
jgi:hypothetical protein